MKDHLDTVSVPANAALHLERAHPAVRSPIVFRKTGESLWVCPRRFNLEIAWDVHGVVPAMAVTFIMMGRHTRPSVTFSR